jgi:hypothetical protein
MIVRSPKYLAGSRGAPCALQLPGCTGDAETTVPCHIRDRHTGRSVKASDLSVADGCHHCHEIFDFRAKLPSGEFLTEPEWHYYALRALQRTLERRADIGLLIVAGFDPQAARTERRVKPRKPPAQRAKVQQRQAKIPQRPKVPAKPQHRATGPIIRKSEVTQ